MISKQQTPKIRFTGFNKEWLRVKLEDIVEIVGGGTPDTNNPYFWNGNVDWYSPTEIGKKVYADKSVKTITELGLLKSSAQILPANKTVLFTSRAGIGDMAILRKDGATNQGFQSFIVKSIDVYFLYSMGSILKEKAIKKASGSTFLEISKNQLKVIELLIPSDKSEQTTIGGLFQNVDHTITLQRRKHEQTQTLKKSLLSKMFPQKEQMQPEIRLQGFSGDWVEKALGNVSNVFSGGTPSVGRSEYYGGRIPFIRSGEVSSHKTELFLTEEGLLNSSAKLVSKGDILYALYGATSGEVSIGKINGAINQAILAIIPSKGYNSEFIAYWLRMNKSNIVNTYLQGGQGNLSGGTIKSLLIKMPSYEEQIAIGQFFKQLDDTLNLQAKQLKTLDNLKKALLAKMFV